MSTENVAPEQELKALGQSLKTVTDEVKRFADQTQTEVKNFGKLSEETKANVEKAVTDMNGLKAQVDAIEQKLARRGSAGVTEFKTLGASVADHDEFKALMARKRGIASAKFETKAILSATGTWGAGTSTSNSLVVADRQAMVPLPMRQMTIRQLLTPGETESNSIEFARQASFTNAAAVVAENTAKPSSDITFNLYNAPVRTIAHRTKAARQILDDAPQLRTFIDGQMRYGLELTEEAEILSGDGTGQHLLGILPQATAYSAPFTITSATLADTLLLAILQASLALYPPSGIVLHPTDWTRVRAAKDAAGNYIFGDPQGVIMPTLWNLPVVPSMAMTAGTFLVGPFRGGAQLFDRLAIEVLISTEDEDNFSKNMVSVRAEERIALAVYTPAAFITGSVPT